MLILILSLLKMGLKFIFFLKYIIAKVKNSKHI